MAVPVIYLAARYSRRDELCGCRRDLVRSGYPVTSRWLDKTHEMSREVWADERKRDELLASFCREDLEDIDRCLLFVAFTEVPESGYSRGGRHVELGYALASGKKVVLVGPRENVFCYDPRVEQFGSWTEFLRVFLKRPYGWVGTSRP